MTGLRSLAVIQNGRCQLISRNDHSFSSFAELRQAISSDLSQDGQSSGPTSGPGKQPYRCGERSGDIDFRA